MTGGLVLTGKDEYYSAVYPLTGRLYAHGLESPAGLRNVGARWLAASRTLSDRAGPGETDTAGVRECVGGIPLKRRSWQAARCGTIPIMPLAPRLSAKSVTALQKVITGNETTQNGQPVSPYCSGPVLVSFFNQFGYEDSYGQGFPSRWDYVETKLAELNGSETLTRVIQEALNPARFLDCPFNVDDAAGYLSRFLEFDGLSLRRHKRGFSLTRTSEAQVETDLDLTEVDHLTREFINDQLQKCDEKMAGEDFDGAITNARSLVEAVLLSLEARLTAGSPAYDGKLPRLYKRVQKALNLDPDKRGLAESLQQILRGMSSIVHGIASMRNQLGDAHARKYRPSRHHATLAVNASKTLAAFLLESYEYQVSRGILAPTSDREPGR